MSKQTTGLRGVKAGNTSICTVGAEGHGLHYRGYAIEDLAENACFEEVVHLLLWGALPTQRELDALKARLRAHRQLPDLVVRVLRALPAHAHPMDVLRTGVSALGIAEPEPDSEDGAALRLLGALPSMLGVWHLGPEALDVEAEDHATYVFHMLKRDAPSALECRMMDASLILYAEHEFNASTFTARVCASTLADFYSCITGAIGTLSGPLHGGANERAMELIAQFETPDAAAMGVREMLARKELIMGIRARGLSRLRSTQCDHQILGAADQRGQGRYDPVRDFRGYRAGDVGREKAVPQLGFLLRNRVPHGRHRDRTFHAHFRAQSL